MNRNEAIAILALFFSLGPIIDLFLQPIWSMVYFFAFFLIFTPPLGIILGIVSAIALRKTESSVKWLAILAIIIGIISVFISITLLFGVF